ncbi:MAG: hypothetical protein EPN93_10200 [Spirochaetes bacterium]|nr:MAG: hypothetical protein EPN93_10200 [Spirochaetota bacterium]
MIDPTDTGFTLQVFSHSGYRDGERPYRIRMGDHELAVREILDRWYDPGGEYFKLRCDDGGIYLVFHDSSNDRWSLTHYLKNTEKEDGR